MLAHRFNGGIFNAVTKSPVEDDTIATKCSACIALRVFAIAPSDPQLKLWATLFRPYGTMENRVDFLITPRPSDF